VAQQTHISGKAKNLKELDEAPLFFIVGRGRSGSTLLRSLFDAHPQVIIPLESRFVQFLFYNYPVRKKWSRDTVSRAIQDLERGFEPPDLHRDHLDEEIQKHASDLTFDRVCKLIYLNTHTEFPKEEILVIGDKNPRYTFFIPQLLKLFPKAKFIHLVRDYRDNIVSIQRAGKLINESGNTYFSMGRWILYNRFVLKYQKKYPDKFRRIQFEELIRDPESVMKDLCAFLDLDYKPEVLNYREGMGKYFNEKGFSALHKSLQTPFDLSKIGEWELELPTRKAIRCEVLGGRFPEKIGYPPKFNIPLLRRVGILLFYYPLILFGQFRFFLKILFYKCRPLMRMAYNILLKMK
jgi:hypothetical protein